MGIILTLFGIAAGIGICAGIALSFTESATGLSVDNMEDDNNFQETI